MWETYICPTESHQTLHSEVPYPGVFKPRLNLKRLGMRLVQLVSVPFSLVQSPIEDEYRASFLMSGDFSLVPRPFDLRCGLCTRQRSKYLGKHLIKGSGEFCRYRCR
jgi:hypothetical protein